MRTADPASHAILDAPPWLWGGDPAALLTECRFRSRRNQAGEYVVQTEERYLRRPPDLVRAKILAGPTVPRTRLNDLAGIQERIDPPMPPMFERELRSRQLKAEQSGRLMDRINFERLLLYATPVRNLPEHLESFHELLKSSPLEGAAEAHPFECSGIALVEVDPALVHRLKIASVWLRLEQDKRLGAGALDHILSDQHDGRAFSSSAGLYSGVYMFDAYLTPLMAALAPSVWAFSVVRTFGTILISFGRSVPGTSGDPVEMLQLISQPGAEDSTPSSQLTAAATPDAVRWWVSGLNLLFGFLSDPATFTNRTGKYQADRHLEALLTVEQVFRRTSSMQMSHRDTNARRTLLFSVLDAIPRLNGWDLVRMFRLSHAERTLAQLEAVMSPAAGEILLPMARRGVDALRRTQNGFFIRKQLKTGDVELHLPNSLVRTLDLETATAQYLKVLRDATHGHGGKTRTAETTSALLAHHDGEVPHDIGLLAYLYLLDVLSNPERTRRCLLAAGR